MSAFSVPARDARAGNQQARGARHLRPLGFPWLCGIGGQEAPPGLTLMLDQAATAVVANASGRVWLFGTWSADQVMVITVGAVQVIFAGTCRFRPAQAQAAVARGMGTGSYDRLALLPGSFHLAVLTPVVTHLYGDTAGLRRLFHTRIGSVTVYADHALALTELTGAAVDDARLATRLVCRVLDHVLDRIAPFVGVRTVPVAHRLTVDQDGRPTVAPYWRAPADDRPLAASAETLRARLTDAVETRVRRVQRVTCDLSGGLDSTALSFVASRAVCATGASLCTITCPAASQTSGNDDVGWATRAVAAQPGTAHVFIDAQDYPLPYQDLDRVPALDEPAGFSVVMAQLRHLAQVVVGHGSQLHLGGYGADAVLLAPLAYLSRTLRTHPLVALAHMHGYRISGRLPPTQTVIRELTWTDTYSDWLKAAARDLDAPGPGALSGPDGHPLTLEWGGSPRVPAWLTADAVELVRSVLIESASVLAPLAPSPAQHGAMQAICYEARSARLRRDAYTGLGVHIEQPYLDADVIETCLATRAHERTDPARAKPLLVEAMRDMVPAPLLARATKSVYDTDFHLGWREHQAEIMALLDGSRLAAHGLIDDEVLKTVIRMPPWTQPSMLTSLNDTLACELWLRGIEARWPSRHVGRW